MYGSRLKNSWKWWYYVLSVKDNKRELRKIKSQFESYNNLLENDNVIYTKTLEINNGRTEERECFLWSDVSCIKDKENDIYKSIKNWLRRNCGNTKILYKRLQNRYG